MPLFGVISYAVTDNQHACLMRVQDEKLLEDPKAESWGTRIPFPLFPGRVTLEMDLPARNFRRLWGNLNSGCESQMNYFKK